MPTVATAQARIVLREERLTDAVSCSRKRRSFSCHFNGSSPSSS